MQQIPYEWTRQKLSEQRERARALFAELDGRRSVRHFSDRAVARDLIESAIRIASTAPSGAHRQPWRFVAVRDPRIQREIRMAAEKEEHAFYEEGRATEEWLSALAPLGTTWEKPFLEVAPWLVVVFEEIAQEDDEGARHRNYYTKESVGIACGFFIAALHHLGLATLTHTPSPMGFLREILGRPRNERPFILFPVGYPAEECQVPDLQRKSLTEIAVFFDASSDQVED